MTEQKLGAIHINDTPGLNFWSDSSLKCQCCSEKSNYVESCSICHYSMCRPCLIPSYYNSVYTGLCIECFAKLQGELHEPYKSRLEGLYSVDGVKYKQFEKDFKSQTK